MTEPTIYNPSIYNGPTVYNNGGGGSGTVTDEYIVVQPIDGIEMPDGRVWATHDLLISPYGIQQGENWQLTPAELCPYGNNPANIDTHGLYYNFEAALYIHNNKSTLIPGWDIPTRAEWLALLNSIANNYSTLQNAGFNDKKNGLMSPNTGNWDGINTYSFYWSRSSAGGDIAYASLIQNGLIDGNSQQWKQAMMSIRIIKDL